MSRFPAVLHCCEEEHFHGHRGCTWPNRLTSASEVCHWSCENCAAPCDERPPNIKISFSDPRRIVDTALVKTLQAVADAFSCSDPKNHSGNHHARDADGNLLIWWEPTTSTRSTT